MYPVKAINIICPSLLSVFRNYPEIWIHSLDSMRSLYSSQGVTLWIFLDILMSNIDGSVCSISKKHYVLRCTNSSFLLINHAVGGTLYI